MILGSYKIIKNGKCVAEKENIVTSIGKDIMLKFLGSSVSSWANSLGVGIGTTTPAITNTALDFEVARNSILLKSPNIMTSTATYSSAPDSYSLVITLPTSGTSGSFGGGTIGTVTSNTATITGLTSTAGMVVGSRINATNGTGNIGTNTLITEVIGPTSIKVLAASGLTAGTITSIGSSYIVSGMAVSGTNIDINSVVTAVSSTNTTTTVTLSHAHATVSGTITFTQRKIILKTSLDTDLVATINEVGVFSNNSFISNGTYSTDIITKFDEGTTVNNSYWSSGTNLSLSYVAAYSLGVSVGSTMLGGTIASPQKPGVLSGIDLSIYNPADTIKLAVYNNTGSTQTSKAITVTFYDNQNNASYGAGSMTWTIPSQSYAAGLTIVSAQLSTLTIANNFNYNVSAILVSTTGNLIFDAIKIDRFTGVNPMDGLVSRTVLSSPVIKTAGDSLEIQYELVLGL
jgi:hypothetical protein